MLDDLASGHPMDRLICGDVGFGKTEVALRAAFVVAMAGKQVAILAPTTLLVRQHFQVMRERFAGLPLRIEQVSRFVPAKQVAEIREGLAAGDVDIVVGTHALLGDKVKFRDLGLVVVDEEQHFGVVHKEKLKQLRAEVHMLAMTATPIPRTLQMALGGLKELSIIATPPLDRLAVRAFVLPTDPVVLREAILREHYRGGQTFYVCPRIEDQGKLAEQLRELVPEVKIGVANGRLPARQLEDVMAAFYDRRIDLLVTTNIIESGLDVPDRQYADRAPRRPLRPVAAVPAARPHRPRQGARLRLFHPAAQAEAARGRRAPAARHPEPGRAGRRLPARLARPGHPRRRQSARRGAVRATSGRSASSCTTTCSRRP